MIDQYEKVKTYSDENGNLTRTKDVKLIFLSDIDNNCQWINIKIT